MIPKVSPSEHLAGIYRDFLLALQQSSFSGEIHRDYATRLVTATDNSVYQILPAAVVYPRSEADVCCLLELLSRPDFSSVKVSPRGGGTGTNGQALCDGVIVDVSRHLRDILEVNLEAGWVRVQPGVVLDQLNAMLAPHGVFFAPNLSPSSRATIGGMISTDASGKGSRIYGKTSEHVLGLRTAILGGEILSTGPLSCEELGRKVEAPGREGHIYREVTQVLERSGARIASELPRLRRFLTGYDLAHLRDAEGRFDLSRVLTGSEGTLGLVTEATLRLTPLPRAKALIAIRYADFDAALRAAQVLVRAEPGAIETIDDTIVSLAQKDVIWHSVAHLIEAQNEAPLAAVNLVEFEAEDARLVEQKVAQLTRTLDAERGQGGKCTGYTVVTDRADIQALWTLRKKGVGLLGNVSGERRPVPFVEDTAVPPEHLADYIAEFRALLDAHGLRYGMFGHVDVGCLHVRPALDLKAEGDEELLFALTEKVVQLVKKYGGVLWGEHGRGYRSEYTPTFFGPELYEELRTVKAAFDPKNQLNPGKLATPAKSTDRLAQIRSQTRGSFDRQIPEVVRQKYASAVYCNGNGACFDWNPDAVMCPSSKVTRERIHSPKGRAGILREWLRLTALQGHDAGASGKPTTQGRLPRSSAPDDFSHEVYDAMAGCLACKACATQCPIHVDVPALRSDFLEQYHSRYRRPLLDYLVAGLERMLGLLVVLPKLTNFLMGLRVTRWVLGLVGLVDTPPLAAQTLARGLALRGAPVFSREALERMTGGERERVVLIAQDAFTTFYEPEIALAAYDLLTRLGRRVFFLPFRENGKALHIKGFLGRFRRLVWKNAQFYREVSAWGVPIVGLEPAVTLTYRDEYTHVAREASRELGFEVKLLQEYLAAALPGIEHELGGDFPRLRLGALRLFGHCTEKTAEPKSQGLWREIFQRFGGDVALESTGCCGMCGVFGHEKAHLEESRGIYAMSWLPRIAQADPAAVLATGHSCRSQVKRFSGFVPRHPVQVLAEALEASGAETLPAVAAE